jgi:hypothetical protein
MSPLLVLLILAGSNFESHSRGLMSADACHRINSIAAKLSNEGRSAIIIQRSLSPFQKQCLYIIETGSLETNEAQLKERLSALDNISFLLECNRRHCRFSISRLKRGASALSNRENRHSDATGR